MSFRHRPDRTEIMRSITRHLVCSPGKHSLHLIVALSLILSIFVTALMSATPINALAQTDKQTNANSAPAGSNINPVALYGHQREADAWYYGQRVGPNGQIPTGAYQRALTQRENVPSFVRPTTGNQPRLNTPWTAIGPAPTGAHSAFGSFGSFGATAGRIGSLAYDPSTSTLYAGSSAGGGLWKSTNNGTSWTPLTDNQASLAIGSIAIDPTNSQIIYVGTGEENFSGDAYYGVGVLKSVDGGSSWTLTGQGVLGGQHISTIFKGVHISKVLVDPNAHTHVLVASDIGLFLSTDSGGTYSLVLGNNNPAFGTKTYSPITDLVLDSSTTPSTVYAGWGSPYYADSRNGIYKSTDGGATFPAPGSPTGSGYPTGTSTGRFALTQAPNGKLYTVISNPSDYSSMGMWSSSDQGATWTMVTSDFASGGPDLFGDDTGSGEEQGWYDMYVRADPSDATGNTVYVGGINIWKTTNGGANFTDLTNVYNGAAAPNPTTHPDQHDLIFFGSATPRAFYAGNDGGVYSSTTGGTSFTNKIGNLAITEFYAGSTTTNFTTNPTIYAGAQDNGTQKYTGSSVWTQPIGGDGGFTANDPANPNIAYHEYPYLTIEKTTNGGTSWFSSVNGINSSDRSLFIAPFVMDPNNASHLLAGTTYLYQTTNAASSWSKVGTQQLATTTSGAISAIAFAPSASTTTYYVGTSKGQVWVTGNNGTNWTAINSGTAGAGRYVTSFGVNPTNAQDVVITFSGFNSDNGTTGGTHVYRSTNGGTSWTDIDGNLPDVPVNSVVRNPTTPATFYIGTDIGFFFTTNGGTSWTQYQTGLPNAAIDQLFTDKAFTTFMAATHGRSMFTLPTAALNSTISLTSTTTTLATSVNPSNFGQPVTFTANVTGSGGTPTGTVNFNDGASTIGSGTLNGSGQATFTTSSLSVGSHNITAVYSGDANFSGSTSAAVVQVVNSPVYTYNLPLLANGATTTLGNTTTYITFQNLSSSATANISVKYYDISSGTYLNLSDTLQLPAKGQKAILPAIASGASVGGVITSDQPLNVVVSEALNAGGSAYNVSASTAANLYSPLALNGQYGFTTQMIVFNAAGSGTATGKIQFYDEQGNLNGVSQTFSLPAHSSKTFNQAASTSGLTSNHAYWAKIVADDPAATLAAQVIEFGPNNFVATFNAIVPSQVKGKLYAPATFNGQFSFVTGMALANPNGSTANLTITYYDANGAQLLAQPLTIAANGVIGVYQPAVSGLGSTVSSATINSDQPLIMTVNERGPGTISGTYVGLASGSTNVAMPVMANGFAGFVTGATVLNTSTTNSANITFTYLDATGNPVGVAQTKTLAPNASFLVYQGDPAQNLPGPTSSTPFFGTALISSDQPLLVTTNALNTTSGLFYTYTEPSS